MRERERMPDRIYAVPDGERLLWLLSRQETCPEAVEYVRADSLRAVPADWPEEARVRNLASRMRPDPQMVTWSNVVLLDALRVIDALREQVRGLEDDVFRERECAARERGMLLTELEKSNDAFRRLQAATNCACHQGEEYVPGSVCQDCFGVVAGQGGEG